MTKICTKHKTKKIEGKKKSFIINVYVGFLLRGEKKLLY